MGAEPGATDTPSLSVKEPDIDLGELLAYPDRYRALFLCHRSAVLLRDGAMRERHASMPSVVMSGDPDPSPEAIGGDQAPHGSGRHGVHPGARLNYPQQRWRIREHAGARTRAATCGLIAGKWSEYRRSHHHSATVLPTPSTPVSISVFFCAHQRCLQFHDTLGVVIAGLVSGYAPRCRVPIEGEVKRAPLCHLQNGWAGGLSHVKMAPLPLQSERVS